ncbi:MAG: Uma2 family endonuclease [Myxococcota bacterium]|nr:Uma2 family endonuclease [Myxococcota bacterium]
MEARELRKLTVDEYITLDRASEERWEYAGGEAFAMVGASMRHNAIVMNISVALANRLRGTPCFPLVSDQKIETTATRAFHYPDIVVVCGKPRIGAKDDRAISNPTVLIEVTSPSTSDYDRAAMFDHYATISELQEFVAVFTESRRIEHRKRTADDQWILKNVIGGDLVLESVGVTLSLDAVYADLDRVEP